MRRNWFRLINLASKLGVLTTLVTGLMLSVAGPAPLAAADPGQWDPTLPATISAGAPGDPLAVANASLQATAQATQTTLDLGKHYEVVTVSFNPHETWQLAAAKKANYVEKYKGKGSVEGWHFLTGQEDNIKKLADAAGFHYKYDPITKQFAHASAILVITPEGRIARYFYGIEYKPRDFRLGLVEASQHKIGSPVDAIMLFCFHYDPMTGKYGLVIMNVIRTLGSATVIGLAALLFVLIRRDRQHRHDAVLGRPA